MFGGQGRPFTQEMIDYIRTTQIDSSKQTLQLIGANITGDLFDIGDPHRGLRRWAPSIESTRVTSCRIRCARPACRRTHSPRRSLRDYDVNEVYAEFSVPLLETLDLSAAVRWSDYSTFGSETTGKLGLRWQPIEALAFRGTYSKGFRAPNLGEL